MFSTNPDEEYWLAYKEIRNNKLTPPSKRTYFTLYLYIHHIICTSNYIEIVGLFKVIFEMVTLAYGIQIFKYFPEVLEITIGLWCRAEGKILKSPTFRCPSIGEKC